MDIRNEFINYYKELGYLLIEEKKLVNNNSESVKYIISSFDNLIPHINDKEKKYFYCTVQRTFRTKRSHEELWGKDGFLLPINIMLSHFTYNSDVEKVLIDSLNFIYEKLNINKNELYCVYCEQDNHLINNTIADYISIENCVCVPIETIRWNAPVNGYELNGHYIKIYKKHYNGFVLILDCNFIEYNNKLITDISMSQFILESCINDKKNVYETKLLSSLLKMAKEDENVNNPYLFVCIFASICMVLADGGNTSYHGSPLRKLFRFLFSSLENKDLSVEKYINDIYNNMPNYGIRPIIDKSKMISIYCKELERLSKIYKSNENKINALVEELLNNKENAEVASKIRYMEKTYGLDYRMIINKLNKNNFKNTLLIKEQLSYPHPTCAIPIVDDKVVKDKEFLKSLFMERK